MSAPGYSRRWIPGGGVGHVFETLDGGSSWTDISGNLLDAPSDALVLEHGHLALATDIGVFTASAGNGANTTWSGRRHLRRHPRPRSLEQRVLT